MSQKFCSKEYLIFYLENYFKTKKGVNFQIEPIFERFSSGFSSSVSYVSQCGRPLSVLSYSPGYPSRRFLSTSSQLPKDLPKVQESFVKRINIFLKLILVSNYLLFEPSNKMDTRLVFEKKKRLFGSQLNRSQEIAALISRKILNFFA